jgi:hypothetical protein
VIIDTDVLANAPWWVWVLVIIGVLLGAVVLMWDD